MYFATFAFLCCSAPRFHDVFGCLASRVRVVDMLGAYVYFLASLAGVFWLIAATVAFHWSWLLVCGWGCIILVNISTSAASFRFCVLDEYKLKNVHPWHTRIGMATFDLFRISPSFGVSWGLCFVILAFLDILIHWYFCAVQTIFRINYI